MMFVNGEAFSNKTEYEKALLDKEVIDEIKAQYDLSTIDGIKGAYTELQAVTFRTVVGDKFDDEVFDLYTKVKNGEFKENKSVAVSKAKGKKSDLKPGKEKSLNKKAKKKSSKGLPEYDEKYKAEIENELKKQNRVRRFVIALLLVVGLGSIGYYVKYYSDAMKLQKNSENWSELKDENYSQILKDVKPVVNKKYDEEVVIPDILDEYLALYNKNKSLIGWIKIADTIIDYPVMQTKDNEYYLKHNFDQKKDDNGCIFLDCNCDVVLGNDNWILYGHHMNNGKMFSSLIKYANEDYYKEHKIIEFDTIYEKGKYEVMYAFRSRIYTADDVRFKYYQFIDASSYEEFESYMEEMADMSLIDTGVTAEYGDKLLTLSTCDYQEENGRFVVVAKRID